MTISLQTSENDFLLKVQRSAFLKSPVVDMQRVGGGGNSRVFKVQCEDGKSYCVKFYFSSLHDLRDRLGTEFGSLNFIYGQGIHDVPCPIHVDRMELMGIYEWIDGQKIASEMITAKDIEFAVDFLAKLEKVSHQPDAYLFNIASEACFSVRNIIDLVETKVQKFQSLSMDSDEQGQLKVYLDQEFKPLLKEILSWVRTNFESSGFYQDGVKLRTLSPSDFGFHNALRLDGSQVKFLDFEYFGWDDPAKTIVDFLFHPARELPFGLKQSFYQKMLLVFDKYDISLRSRIRCYYPLLGLNWCLILLNIFIKNDLKRRQFAMVDIKDIATIQQRQLKKARDLLLQLRGSYMKFPYEY